MAALAAVVPGWSGRPPTPTSPPSRARRPQIIEIEVVLPAPFGPRRPYVSPRAISKPTPSTASRAPNRFTSPLQVRVGASPPAAGDPGAGPGPGPGTLLSSPGGIADGAVSVILESSLTPDLDPWHRGSRPRRQPRASRAAACQGACRASRWRGDKGPPGGLPGAEAPADGTAGSARSDQPPDGPILARITVAPSAGGGGRGPPPRRGAG